LWHGASIPQTISATSLDLTAGNTTAVHAQCSGFAMEDASFIATVGSVYVATVWSMGNPDLRSALKSRSHVEQREWDDH